jgi:NADH-quinone oxidoreductase subunit C
MVDDTHTHESGEAREIVHEASAVDEVADALAERFGGVAHLSHTQPVVYVDRGTWADAARHLRDEERFTQCVDITAVDHLSDVDRWLPDGVTGERFEVVANYLSHPRNRRVRVIAQVPTDDPQISSIVDVYPGVDFAEREVYDLMGIEFLGHPDLARILMPDDWVGHPLRKDDAPAAVPVTFKGDPSPR